MAEGLEEGEAVEEGGASLQLVVEQEGEVDEAGSALGTVVEEGGAGAGVEHQIEVGVDLVPEVLGLGEHGIDPFTVPVVVDISCKNSFLLCKY